MAKVLVGCTMQTPTTKLPRRAVAEVAAAMVVVGGMRVLVVTLVDTRCTQVARCRSGVSHVMALEPVPRAAVPRHCDVGPLGGALSHRPRLVVVNPWVAQERLGRVVGVPRVEPPPPPGLLILGGPRGRPIRVHHPAAGLAVHRVDPADPDPRRERSRPEHQLAVRPAGSGQLVSQRRPSGVGLALRQPGGVHGVSVPAKRQPRQQHRIRLLGEPGHKRSEPAGLGRRWPNTADARAATADAVAAIAVGTALGSGGRDGAVRQHLVDIEELESTMRLDPTGSRERTWHKRINESAGEMREK